MQSKITSCLGANLLSQAFGSTYANTSSAIPPKEPITTESTDASDRLRTTENENLSNSPPDITETPPRETFSQEQGPTNSQTPQPITTPVEDDSVNNEIQTVISPAQQIVDDTVIESLEPIQPSVENDVGTLSAVPSPQPEPHSEKALVNAGPMWYSARKGEDLV